MSIKEGYQERYKSGHTPWDVGKPDFNLIEVVTGHPVPPGKALDVGCGTGDNTIWLARNGFTVIGTDTSDVALDKAREKALEAGVKCEFVLVDFMEERVEGGPFGFLFDRGCFHSFGLDDERARFAKNVAAHLGDGGLWLTLLGNADEDRQGRPGPPQRSAKDIVLAVEPCFEILSLSTTHFGSNRPTPPRAWRCLLKKR